jgi:hypothetical protein
MVMTILLLSQQTGSIRGSVVDSEGKAVANLALRLEKPAHISVKPPGGNLKHKITFPLQTKPAIPPIATATTDAEGKFTMNDIAPGAYRIVGGSNSTGWVFQSVTVDAGKETKLELKLTTARK